MKKITVLFLVLCMILPSFTACVGGETEETTEAPVVETTPEGTTAPAPSGLLLVAQGATDYIIVRPTECQNFITDAMTDLRKAIEAKYGVAVKPQDDWIKGLAKGEAYVTEAFEILIGETCRGCAYYVNAIGIYKPSDYGIVVPRIQVVESEI